MAWQRDRGYCACAACKASAWKHIQTHSYTFSTVIKAMQPIVATLSTIASRRIRLRAHTFAHTRCAPATMGRGSHSASAATREQLITKVSRLYIPSQVAYGVILIVCVQCAQLSVHVFLISRAKNCTYRAYMEQRVHHTIVLL